MDQAGDPDRHRPSVLFYVHALAGGGAERVVATLASTFAKTGWRVLLAVDREDRANRDFLDPDVTVEILGDHHGRATWRLARLLRTERPDISLSAMAAANVKHAMASLLAGRRHHAVLSYHAFAGSEPKRLSRIGYRLLPILSRLTMRTVAVSRALRDDLVTRWRADPRRTVTIYNPIVAALAPSRPMPQRNGPATILTAGRLVPDKDTRAVVRAFAAVAPVCDARLVILGEGPDRPAVESEVERSGLSGRVEMVGYVSDPRPFYRQASCFVTASRLESFSMVVAEALAFGLPVVAVDSPGPREVLADGQYGRLVPPGDDRALAKALLGALNDPGDPMPRLRRAGVFSPEAALDAYGRLFAEVQAEAAGARPSPPRPAARPASSATQRPGANLHAD